MSASVKKPLRAGQVTIILIGVLVVLICILIGGSIFAATRLLRESSDATHAQIDADISADDPSRLEALKAYLAKNATGISQTAALTSGLGQYNQNSIVAAISGYAGKAGVNITSFDFGTGTPTGAVPVPGAAAPGNVINITLASPLKYKNFIVFLRLLEQGLMPAQVTNAQISVDTDSSDGVVVSSLSVKVIQ